MENSKNSKKMENSKNSKKIEKFKKYKKIEKHKNSAIDENLGNRRHGSKKRFMLRR